VNCCLGCDGPYPTPDRVEVPSEIVTIWSWRGCLVGEDMQDSVVRAIRARRRCLAQYENVTVRKLPRPGDLRCPRLAVAM